MAGKRGMSDWPSDGAWGGNSPSARRNTLGLDGKGVRALSEKLETISGGMSASSLKREFVRWPFHRDRIPVLIEQPGGTQLTLRLCCRNISRGGMSLFHNSFVHEGSRCVLRLPHPTHGDLDVQGTIVRCKHRGGVVHEIGVKFDSPIDAKQFVSAGGEAEFFSLEKVDAEKLAGVLMLVEPEKNDQKLFEHFMRRTRVRLRTVATIKEAMASLKEPADVIVTNFQLPDGTGMDLMSQVRAAGMHAPIVMLTPDASRETRMELSAVRCDGLLSKPLTYDRVVRAIAEFLGSAADGSGDESKSILKPDDPSLSMLPWFLEELKRIASELRKAVDSDNVRECESLCMTLKGSAPSMGFPGMATSAERALQMLSWTKSPKESSAVLRDVITACERARAA
ncbi:MAG TPA: response regulator [Phycisphaerales bacterium]